MKLPQPSNLKTIAELVNCPFEGDPNLVISGINEIHQVESGDIVFVDHPKYYEKALNSAADVIIINKKVAVPEGKGILISDNPFDVFNQITRTFRAFKVWEQPKGDEFEIGENSFVFPNATIGHHVKIGKNSVVHAGAVICDYTEIGDHVIIGPNAVIGFDAFYYKKKESGYDRLHSFGSTWIQNHVEIGALTTIDRGVSGKTIIGKGTKIDNQVHIGHDTVVGENCLFAANVGVAGCVTIKNNVTLWGQVGVVSDVTIHENVIVLGQSGVGVNLPANKTYFGSPCGEARTKFKELAAFKKLPQIIEHL
ncbi:UDP-3-O-(3-hydroxymyristoyl)glucosamine N-acyltransferase [Putridiphycobacter roseus]|uniref:UDP-3-O-(3-hydroxymyristoyl)glucosamine N-acyltransferase n=1 Tax=Putridiphycobacter roseus TaxID=2219161 RepID=A0A2W1N286_9FLAO|nr:LpxD N-terminal domain-containing protein [Putridiphycobacter roseus]PZE17934.1 UDP-3-O-(3-hydroxymyristoyl)glucosamine N-acyltransferase [Putridiphycobacter roseus]